MVEAIQKDERRLPVTAAKVAALMFVVAAFVELLSVSLAGFYGEWDSAPSGIGISLAMLTLAWSLLRLKRWGWMACIIVSGVGSAFFLFAFGAIVYMLVSTPPDTLRLVFRRGGIEVLSQFSLMLSGGLAMLIAFFALLSKSARREFGIGRFAAPKAAS